MSIRELIDRGEEIQWQNDEAAALHVSELKEIIKVARDMAQESEGTATTHLFYVIHAAYSAGVARGAALNN